MQNVWIRITKKSAQNFEMKLKQIMIIQKALKANFVELCYFIELESTDIIVMTSLFTKLPIARRHEGTCGLRVELPAAT